MHSIIRSIYKYVYAIYVSLWDVDLFPFNGFCNRWLRAQRVQPAARVQEGLVQVQAAEGAAAPTAEPAQQAVLKPSTSYRAYTSIVQRHLVTHIYHFLYIVLYHSIYIYDITVDVFMYRP